MSANLKSSAPHIASASTWEVALVEWGVVPEMLHNVNQAIQENSASLKKLLEEADGHVKTALVMGRLDVDSVNGLKVAVQGVADLLGRQLVLREQARGETLPFADQAEQDVLGPDVLVVELLRLLAREGHHLLRSVGEATLIIELRDSLSNEVIYRAVERRAVQNPGGQMMRSNTATNWAEVRRWARRWCAASCKNSSKRRTIRRHT